MILLIAGLGEPPNTSKNGFLELVTALAGSLPGQQVVRLGWKDRPYNLQFHKKRTCILAHSHGMDVAAWVVKNYPGQLFGVGNLDGVKQSSFWNPLRGAYYVGKNVDMAQSWLKPWYVPPFSSGIAGYPRKYVSAGHNHITQTCLDEIVQFTQEVLA
jgi:hypothetical protein